MSPSARSTAQSGSPRWVRLAPNTQSFPSLSDSPLEGASSQGGAHPAQPLRLMPDRVIQHSRRTRALARSGSRVGSAQRGEGVCTSSPCKALRATTEGLWAVAFQASGTTDAIQPTARTASCFLDPRTLLCLKRLRRFP